jgi:hypothetical protein
MHLPIAAARKALERAASIYDEEGKMMGGAYGAKDAFLGTWSRKSFDDWTLRRFSSRHCLFHFCAPRA